MALPTGTLTFLFTDIEGSTQLWENYPDTMGVALVRHNTLIREAVERHQGVVFKTTGDGVAAAFPVAPAALAAALAAQHALRAEPWPAETVIRVRMGLHTGAAEYWDGDYLGPVLNRTARLMAAGYGGQTLLSGVTQELCRDSMPPGVSLFSMGEHRLKDLTRPETIFQLVHSDLPAPDAFPPLKTLDNAFLPNNLPQQLTSFIGRETQIREVAGLLKGTRLLTLSGTGGTGKTRLSLQVAAEVLGSERFPDGVWQVELAPLSDPSLVAQAVAQVLGVREQAGQPLSQTLRDFLQSKRLLLLLDNCEHLIAACATLAADVLRVCPGVAILATSREPLNVRGEKTYRVPSLSLPETKQDAVHATPETVSQFEAVRLFIDRALLVKPVFEVTNANAPALAQICARLDGIPLAIELAAARARSLSVEQINERLDRRFRLLTGGDRSALPRQQTLQALIDWSFDLLNEVEKVLLARLSVFAGGWTLSAAETVCGFEPVEAWETLDLLTSLTDKSLVLADEVAGATRYTMLETMRQYGADRLAERQERDAVVSRHLDWCLTLGEEAASQLKGPEQADWLNRLETEHDNLRAALSPTGEPVQPAEAVSRLRLAGALAFFWEVRGYTNEGRESLTRALQAMETMQAVPGAGAAKAKALGGIGRLAMMQGDYPMSRDCYDQCLILGRESGDKRGIAYALIGLGTVAFYQSAYGLTRDYYEQGLAMYRELGDKHGIASTLQNIGSVCTEQGDLGQAYDYFEQCLMAYREIDDKRGIAFTLLGLGNVASQQGDHDLARDYFEQCLIIYRELGDKRYIAQALLGLGPEASHRGEHLLARDYFEQGLVACRELGDKIGIAYALIGLGTVACELKDYEWARDCYGQCLAVYREIGDKRGIAYGLEQWAELLWYEGQADKEVVEVIVFWSAAAALREAIGTPIPPVYLTMAEEWLDLVRAAIRSGSGGEGALRAAEAEGRALPWESAVARALKE